MEQRNRPQVGVGVMIMRDGKVLLGKRKGSHGDGEYSFTGGHLEYMESIVECAKRETREEAGIEIDGVKFLCIANSKSFAPKHYLYVGLIAEWKSGEPRVMEPDRTESWDWYDFNSLPEPLFQPVAYSLEAYRTGKNFFDN